jgi:hypothetical protein
MDDLNMLPTPLQIECERLRKEAETGKEILGKMMAEYGVLRDENERLRKTAQFLRSERPMARRLAECEKDAERYRCLRAQTWIDWDVVDIPYNDGFNLPELLDLCIDALMKTHNAALRGDSGLIAGVPLESMVVRQNDSTESE